MRRLTQILVGRFVVRDTALAPVDQPRTPAQPFALSTDTGSVPAVATDSGLEHLFNTEGPPALRAQRVLAALAEIAYEAPSQARGVVLAMPANWKPDLSTVTLLLRSLGEYPLVKPVTLDDLFAEVAPEERDGAPLQRTLAPISTSGVRPLFASEYDDAARALRAYEAMVGPHDPSVAAGQHALLLSLSTSNSRAESLAYLATIHANLRSLTSGIKTTAKALTLTARRAELPLSFQNDTKRDGIHVRVHLDSPKLIFPNGPDVDLRLPIGHYTKRIPVEARAVGHVHDDGDARVGRRIRRARPADAGDHSLGGVQRYRHRDHDRRAAVPRGLVGEPLPPVAARAPARVDGVSASAEHPRSLPATASSARARPSRRARCCLGSPGCCASRCSPTRSGARASPTLTTSPTRRRTSSTSSSSAGSCRRRSSRSSSTTSNAGDTRATSAVFTVALTVLAVSDRVAMLFAPLIARPVLARHRRDANAPPSST